PKSIRHTFKISWSLGVGQFLPGAMPQLYSGRDRGKRPHLLNVIQEGKMFLLFLIFKKFLFLFSGPILSWL
ncbi:MAG: hypothetical protein KBS74_00225, partial [Clostridiales bacterium]|nr:hypothetical protein [Candidatus Cacconaster stercorequi]